MAYRSSPHETTGITPNYMMFGREITLPLDIMLELPHSSLPTSSTDYAKKLRFKLTSAYEIAHVKLKTAAQRQKNLYDQGTYGERLQKGDLVWYAHKLRKKGQCPKLQPKWKGPFLVTAVLNNVVIEIQKKPNQFAKVHYDLCKPYLGKHLPRWLTRAKKQLMSNN